MTRRRSVGMLSRLVTGVAVMGAVACLLPAGAWGHAALRQTTPEQDSVVTAAPTAVSMHFSEDVTIAPDAVHVFAPDGAEVTAGTARRERDHSVVTAGVKAGGAGTYYVAFRVTSADGHTVNGTFSYSVRTHTKDTAASRKATSSVQRNASASLLANLSRVVSMLGLLVAVGGVLFAAFLAPGWQPRFVGAALTALYAGLAGNFLADAAITRGTSIGGALSGAVLRAEVQNPYGRAALVTGSVAVLAIAALPMLRPTRTHPVPSPVARFAAAFVFAVLGATISLAGHAVVTHPVGVRLPLDIVHVLAASLWLGGLVQLWAMRHDALEHTAAVQRFSNAAFVTVMVLLATGIYATLAELSSVHELTKTRYGHLVLAKLVLFVATMPLAWANKTAYVPAVGRRPQDAGRMLSQYVLREAALLVTVVALTAWLVGTDPRAGV